MSRFSLFFVLFFSTSSLNSMFNLIKQSSYTKQEDFYSLTIIEKYQSTNLTSNIVDSEESNILSQTEHTSIEKAQSYAYTLFKERLITFANKKKVVEKVFKQQFRQSEDTYSNLQNLSVVTHKNTLYTVFIRFTIS